MKYIKQLNEDLSQTTIKATQVDDLVVEKNEKFFYIQQGGSRTVQQVVIEKAQAAELIKLLQEFAK